MCLNGRSTIGRGDQPGVAGQPGERVRRVAEHGLDAPPPAGALGLDRPTLLVRQAADLEQPVDVEAQARLGGQPAGRGVGRVEEAQLLQVAITLRMVAAESWSSRRRAIVREPTGSPVAT
jgi:hypothetical protein